MRPTYTSLLPWLANPSLASSFQLCGMRHADSSLYDFVVSYSIPEKAALLHLHFFCTICDADFFPFWYLISSLSQNTSLVDCYIISRSSPTHCALHYYGSSMTKAQRHVGVPRWLTECCWYHRSFMVQPYIIPIYQRFSSNHSSIKPHTMFSIITFSSSSSSSLVSSNINNDTTLKLNQELFLPVGNL